MRCGKLLKRFAAAEIDAAISSHSVAQAKKFIEGDESALPQLKKDLSALAAERREVLKSHGYPENYVVLAEIRLLPEITFLKNMEQGGGGKVNDGISPA